MGVSSALEQEIAKTSFEFPLSPSGVVTLPTPILNNGAEQGEFPVEIAFASPESRQGTRQLTRVEHIPHFKKATSSKIKSLLILWECGKML